MAEVTAVTTVFPRHGTTQIPTQFKDSDNDSRQIFLAFWGARRALCARGAASARFRTPFPPMQSLLCSHAGERVLCEIKGPLPPTHQGGP